MPAHSELEVITSGAARVIQLTQGKVAVVDQEDYETVAQFKWYANKSHRTFYARRMVRVLGARKMIAMHAAIMGKPPRPGIEIDHRNGNGLDNRRTNLRWSTVAQNKRNRRKTRGTSVFKGVSWAKPNNMWRAYIHVGNRQQHIGFFHDEQDAAHAYDAAAKLYFGEFARLNYPEHDSTCTSTTPPGFDSSTPTSG